MRTTLQRALGLATALALLGTGLAVAYDLPRLPKELALKRSPDSPGQVIFRHESHVDAATPTCLTCTRGASACSAPPPPRSGRPSPTSA
jgi:hypothetical protein